MSEDLEKLIAAGVAAELAKRKNMNTGTIFDDDDSDDDDDDRTPDEIVQSLRAKDTPSKSKPKKQSTVRDHEYYRKLRKEDPRKYKSIAIQNQLIKDRQQMGHAKFWGKE